MRAVSGDWRFARRPFWLGSHLFALVVVVAFIAFGFWQLDRLDQRRSANAIIEARSGEAIVLDQWPDSDPDGSDLDFQAVEATIQFVDPELARVANRSSGGVAGEYVVAVAELIDGTPIAVNRGFVPTNVEVLLDPVPTEPVVVTGWLRASVDRGRFGVIDDGVSPIMPRLDTVQTAARYGQPMPPVWIQLATVDEAEPATLFPEPVPLPPLDDGPHLSYAVQWFIFATLGVVFYGLLLRRRAAGHQSTVTAGPAGANESVDRDEANQAEVAADEIEAGRAAPTSSDQTVSR